MLRIIRKHNKWLMVAFGILLMIAFTAPEMIQRLGHAASNRPVATLNGQEIRQSDVGLAHQEMSALERFVPPLIYNIGMAPQDTTHWILLTHEAEAAGLIGNAADGRDFMTELAQMRSQWELQRLQQTDPQEWIQYMINDELREGLVRQIEEVAPFFFQQSQMNEQQMYETIAKLRGVVRLVVMHGSAARFSDRHAMVEAKHAQDSAVIDYLFIRAADYAAQIPDPTPEQLQAHFEEFKDLRPGEGDYGIGYTLPPRAQLEWLKIDRSAMERGITVDPVEVSKRHMLERTRYPGEFSEERSRIEADMRAELVERSMQAAHGAVYAEILGATRRLDQHGRYRRIPENWDEIRPRMENIAHAVVQAVGRNDGPSIPLPEVQRRTDRWLTHDEIAQLEDLGRTFLRRGDNMIGVADLVFAAREFEGPASPIAIQAGIPFESFLSDHAGNRYYLTILGARQESPPESAQEIWARAVRDFKTLAAYRQLQEQAPDFQRIARQDGLEAVPAAAALPNAQPVQVRTNVRVSRDTAEGDANLADPAVRAAIVKAATNIDPFATSEAIQPEDSTLAIPSDRGLGVAVVRILAKAPLTTEAYRSGEQRLITTAQRRELEEASADREHAFSLVSMLQRHNYVSGGTRIQTAEELRTQEEWEAAAGDF